MSIEYTIDIQLTELGFPDVLQQSQQSSGASPPASHKHKARGLSQDAEEEAAAPAAKRSKQGGSPGQSEEEEHQGKGTGSRQQSSENEDSDDSEVSDMYDEEEEADEEEECEEEESANSETSLSSNYSCSVCNLQFSSNFKLQDHMNLHTGARPYRCAECGKRFCQNYNYRIHLRTHAQIMVDYFLCRVCQVTFPSKNDLEKHLSKTHPEDKFYECDLCKRVFTSLEACESHVQLHKTMPDMVCKVCGRKFSSPKSFARHQKRSCRRSYKCTDCTQIFTNKNVLLKHSFSHLGLLPYTCVRCRSHFRLAKLYRRHKCQPQRIHCVACLREFLSNEDFQQHKKDTGCWGNQEPKGDEIRCLECGERFDTSEELKKHAGAHQRVLKCAECGKGFRSALLLMSHMGGHAGKSPCLCQSCGLGFPHQQNYDSHLKTCGQTPQPVSGPKKHQTSKSAKSPVQNLTRLQPILPTPATTTAVVPTRPYTPAAEPPSPAPASTGSAPADGLWKLTLNNDPPPGVNLVVFLPICPQTNGLDLSTGTSGNSGVNATPAEQIDSPLDLVTGIKREKCGEPLDLSNKSNTSDVPLGRIKNEPEEFTVSRLDCENGHGGATNQEEADSCSEMQPMNLSSPNTSHLRKSLRRLI